MHIQCVYVGLKSYKRHMHFWKKIVFRGDGVSESVFYASTALYRRGTRRKIVQFYVSVTYKYYLIWENCKSVH